MGTPRLLTHERRVLAVVVVTALVTLVLGLHYAGQHSAGRIDKALDTRLRYHLRGHLLLLHRIVALADPLTVVVVCALLGVAFFVLRRRRLAALAVLGPATASGTTEFVLKPAFGRRLNDWLSFPSGHTTVSVAIAIVLVVFFLGPSRPAWSAAARWTASAAAVIGAGAVATALVGSGYHYATDTIGGLCAAVCVVLSVALVIDRTADAAARRRANARSESAPGEPASGPQAGLPKVDA